MEDMEENILQRLIFLSDFLNFHSRPIVLKEKLFSKYILSKYSKAL